jgi:hypothetical protein
MSTADDHLDLDAIAAFDEGLDDERARHLDHVSGCAECGRRLDLVRSTRAALAELPDDPMPENVAERVHSALPRDPTLTTVVPVGGRRRRWAKHPTFAALGAAAAGIALIAAIAVGATRSSHNGGGEAGSSGDTALPRAGTGAGAFPILSSGSHYTDGTMATLAATLDALARSGGVPTPASPGAAAPGRSAKDALALSSTAPVPPSLRALHDDRTTLLACVAKLAGGPARPLAVDFARFTGGLRHVKNAPAVVILLPGLTSTATDVAFVVGPKCLTDSSQDLYAFQGSIQPG